MNSNWRLKMSVPVDAFPHLQTMNGNAGVDLEAQPHVGASNIEHRDLHQLMKAIGPADYDRLPTFSR